MATRETKAANLRAIKETVNWWSPGGDWRGLHSIAKRESGMNHYIAARSQADRQGARRAWDNRMRAALEDKGNPYTGPEYQHEERGGWFNSHGLFQMMAPYHVPKWSWTAPPSVLNHPIIATVIAARLWNRGVRAGAKTLCELRSYWKYGRLGVDPTPTQRCQNTKARLEAMGYPRSMADRPLSSFKLSGFGTAPQSNDQENFADVADLLGLPPDATLIGPEWTPGDPGETEDPDTPDEEGEEAHTVKPGPILAVLFALFGFELYRSRRRQKPR